jgi:uncharacterized membrane protein YeaQ/YmgE (transglycosylase-associated protein family)
VSIIAWIILGLGAGLLANMLAPGRRWPGLILTCAVGVAGGWLATRLFHVHTLLGFFNLSTWLTAIAGAAILLLVFHRFTMRPHAGQRPADRLGAPVTALTRAVGVNRPVGATGAPGNVRAADRLCRSRADGLLLLSLRGSAGQVPW